jgi:hypothetical protein
MPAFFSTASEPLILLGKKTRISSHDRSAHAVPGEDSYSGKTTLNPLTKEFLERGQEVSQPLAIQTAGLSLMLGSCWQ